VTSKALVSLVCALGALACDTPALVVETYDEQPDVPREEHVPLLNRKLAIMSEATGTFTSGERFHYIAYLTREEVPDQMADDPLWAEMQALWQQRRRKLDPAHCDVVIVDARVFPGTPGSRTRRAVYVSRKGHWVWDQVASVVFEETP
jgi:hypothetical protein